MLNHENNEFRSLENEYFNVRNAYNKDTAFLKGKCHTLENNLRNARRRNEENVKLKENFEIAEQNAWILIESLQDERKDTKNYKEELNMAKESLKGKQEEMEKLKENLSRKMKETQGNNYPGNEIEELKKLLEKNEKNLADKGKKLKEALNNKENARKEHEKYRKNTEKDLDDVNQLYREARMGNSKENELNGKERKHYEMLKSEETKMRNNSDARYYLEKDAKEKNEIMMDLRGEVFELKKKLEANRNNEYEANVKDKSIVKAKSLEKYIKSSGIQIIGLDGNDFKSLEVSTKEAISFYSERMNVVLINSAEYHSDMSNLNKLKKELNEIKSSKEEKSKEDNRYSLQVPLSLGQVRWEAPKEVPQRFQSRFEPIQQEKDIPEVIYEQELIYNSLCLQGSEEQGGATALEGGDWEYAPISNDDNYDELY